jgi:hypothetical protein
MAELLDHDLPYICRKERDGKLYSLLVKDEAAVIAFTPCSRR